MDFQVINAQFLQYGFELGLQADGQSRLPNLLDLQSLIDGQSLLSILLNIHHPLTKFILEIPDLIDIFIQQFNQTDLAIPHHFLGDGGFELVASKKDRKYLQGSVKNGLYTYLQEYAENITFPLKPIQRRDRSRAFMIELEDQANHLSIDEYYVDTQEHGRFFYYYAHVSMEKAGARVRLYFDEDLKLIKTTAYIEEDGVKLRRIDSSELDLKLDDYQSLFNVLKTLRDGHQDKIQELNLHFTPQFMFIKNAEQLEHCRLEIAKINQLKSPYIDNREVFLQQDFKEPQSPSKMTQADSDEDYESSAVVTAGKNVKKRADVHKQPLSRKEIKKEKRKQAINEIGLLITKINQLLSEATDTNQNIIGALSDILNLEFLYIHHSDELLGEEKEYDEIIEDLKLRCLDFLHLQYIENRLDYLNFCYDEGKAYIDSIIYGFMKELVAKLNSATDTLDAQEKLKFKKLTDLLQIYYDRNDLFERFFHLLNKQLAFNPKTGVMYSFVMRAIKVLDNPSFLSFLIDKGLLNPSDCIGICNFNYISLIQFILMTLDDLDASFSSLLERFLALEVDIFALTNPQKFQRLIENPESYRIGSYQFNGSEEAKTRKNDTVYVERLSRLRGEITTITRTEFAQVHGCHLRTDALQLTCQNFFILNPILALNYLAVLLGSKFIHRRVIRSETPNFLLFTDVVEMESKTIDIAMDENEKQAMTYLMYPVKEAPLLVKQQMQIAYDLFERIKSQAYLNDARNDDAVILELMNDLKKARNVDQTANIILSAFIYITLMPWSKQTFKKYNYFMLRYIEALKTTPHSHLIYPNLTLLFEMLAAFNDPALTVLCKRQMMTSIEKITNSVREKESLIRSLQ